MANWGVLQGLGDGLQQFGNAWSDREKAKLAEKLQQDREVRAEARQTAREERQEAARLRQVDPRTTSTDIDPTTGRMVKRLRNSEYQDLGTAEVGQLEAESIRTQQEAEQAQLRTRSLDAQLKELNLGRLPEKWGQEDAMHRARLSSESALQAQRYASAGASNRRGLESSVTEERNSASDARILMDTYSDLVKEYTTAPRDGTAILTRAQAEDVAQAVIQRSVDNRLNPGQVAQAFRQALRITAERNKNAAPSGGQRRSGTLLGN